MSTATKMSEQKQNLTTNKSFKIRGCQHQRKLENWKDISKKLSKNENVFVSMDPKCLHVYKSLKVETWVHAVVNTKQTISTNVLCISKYYI